MNHTPTIIAFILTTLWVLACVTVFKECFRGWRVNNLASASSPEDNNTCTGHLSLNSRAGMGCCLAKPDGVDARPKQQKGTALLVGIATPPDSAGIIDEVTNKCHGVRLRLSPDPRRINSRRGRILPPGRTDLVSLLVVNRSIT